MNLSSVSLIIAIVLFVVSGSFVPEPHPWHNRLICWGLAFFAASFLLLKM
jgi:hypothetical protein